MDIAVFSITSQLHDEATVATLTKEFLDSLQLPMTYLGNDFSTYGSHDLNLIYIRTGGTEGIFKKLLPQLASSTIYLLTSGKSNSLAASMEILSYLRQHNMKGEIIHGSADYMARRITLLAQTGEARRRLAGCRLGIIGQPSDWLISSLPDKEAVGQRLGIELVDIPMQQLLQAIQSTPATMPEAIQSAPAIVPETIQSAPATVSEASASDSFRHALPGANQIYMALKKLVEEHRLQGFTLRCFDLLTAVRNTGCLALAKLNSEGLVAGCEGDVPAMLSMMIVRALAGISGFQANPANINPERGIIVLAHCTIPLDMVEHYEFDTHFESGIGIGIRGRMKEGPVTLFKVSGDLSRWFIAEGSLEANLSDPNLCRTQLQIRLDQPELASYFLTDPIGNHHIVIPGRWSEQLACLRQTLLLPPS